MRMRLCPARFLPVILSFAWLPLLLAQNALAQNPNDPCSMLGNQFAYAAYTGDDASIAGLMRAGCDPNTPDPSNHLAPLIYAITSQHIRSALLLVNGNAQVNTWSEGWSALALAVYHATLVADDHEWIDLITTMLDHGAVIDPVNSSGWTPLLIACQSPQHLSLIALLLAHHADPNHVNASNLAPLEDALMHQWQIDKTTPLLAVRLLLAFGANTDPPAFFQWPPIEWAVHPETATPQSAQLLAMLLASHANPNRLLRLTNNDADPVQVPPLYFALTHPDPALATILVHSGASIQTAIDWKNVFLPVFASACEIGPDRIRQIANLGADFNWIPPGGKDVPSDSAASSDNCWTAPNFTALIDLGADLQQGLVNASAYAEADQIQSLIDAGADEATTDSILTSSNMPDGSLLRYAAEGNEDIVSVLTALLNFGIDPLDVGSEDEHKGQTALDLLNERIQLMGEDENNLAARKILLDAMQQRRITNGFIAAAWARLASDVQHQRPLMADKLMLFRDALERYAADPNSIELRVFLADLDSSDNPSLAFPPTPAAAALATQAQAAYSQAHSRSDLLPVAALYERALRLSPWVGAYYLTLVRIYQLTGSRDRSIRYAAMAYNASLANLDTLETIVFGKPQHTTETHP